MTLICFRVLPFWLVDVKDEGGKNDWDLMSERWRGSWLKSSMEGGGRGGICRGETQ